MCPVVGATLVVAPCWAGTRPAPTQQWMVTNRKPYENIRLEVPTTLLGARAAGALFPSSEGGRVAPGWVSGPSGA